MFLYDCTRYTIVYSTKVIRKYMISNVSFSEGGGALFLYDCTRYTIVYTTKVIQKYMISNVSISEGEGGIVFTIIHAMQCKLGKGGGRI